MKYISDLLGMLALRVQSLRLQAERRMFFCSIVCFSAGFLAYILLRNQVYATLPELIGRPVGPFLFFFRLHMIQTLIFLLSVYIPVLILLSNSILGEGLGLSISGREYRMHISALLPLWGLVFLITAPVQWIVPHFIIIGMFEVSVGFLIRSVLLAVYTAWVVKHLNCMTMAQAVGVFILSWFTLPVFYLLTYVYFMLLFLVLISSAFLISRWFQRRLAHRSDEASLQKYLAHFNSNPEDADSCFRTGKIFLKRGNNDEAAAYFEKAFRIDPENPDYGYYLGRTCEMKRQWSRVLQLYEGTYRKNPEYASGDICRELGKAYVHMDNVDKGMELLTLFLKERDTDPEGRYWLAVALHKNGNTAQMVGELNRIMGQVRTNPRSFRKVSRYWACRARDMLRETRASDVV